jgi:hypothetical protein
MLDTNDLIHPKSLMYGTFFSAFGLKSGGTPRPGFFNYLNSTKNIHNSILKVRHHPELVDLLLGELVQELFGGVLDVP